MVLAIDRRRDLQVLAWTATGSALSLQSILRNAVLGGGSLKDFFGTLSSTGGNGRNIAYLVDRFKTVTIDEARRLFFELWESYSAACVTLGIALPGEADTSQDASILATMLAADNFQTVRESRTDHTTLRFPSTGIVQ